MTTNAHSPETRAAAVADYVTGMTMDEVAAKNGASASSVSNWLKAANVERRGRGRKDPAPCIVDGCSRRHNARNYCTFHYEHFIQGRKPRKLGPPIHMEDVEWMADTGEEWSRAIERLGVKESSLMRYLERAKRYDLVRKLQGRTVGRMSTLVRPTTVTVGAETISTDTDTSRPGRNSVV